MISKSPTSSRLHPRGMAIGTAGLTMLAAGLWRADGTMAALGLAAWAALALAWFFARLNLSRLALSLEAPAKTAAGVVFPARLTLRNPRRICDAFSVKMELELAGKTAVGGRAGWVAAGSAADLELRVSVPDRAKAEHHAALLRSVFPLGFWECTRRLQVAHEMLVFPRVVVPRELRAPGVMMDASPVDGASAGEAAGEPRGLRPWRSGDAPKRLHWPATVRAFSRGAGPVVREADPPGFHPRRCVVMFHSFGNDGSLIRPDRFERALSLTAGTLRHLHALGVPLKLMADFDGWREHPVMNRAQLAAAQECLAVAKRSAATEAHDLHATVSALADDDSLVILSDMPPPSWLHGLPKRALPAVAPDIRSHEARKTRTHHAR